MTKAAQTKVALYFFAIIAGSWSADAAELTLLPQAHAKGSLILLGDVVDIKSTDADRVEQLKRVELFPAPAQQRSKLMHVRELIELLVLHGIDLKDLSFTGTRTTRIYAAGQEPAVIAAGLVKPIVETTEMVVVTRRALNRGDIIREADVELQPIDPKAQRLQIATERHAVVGMELLYAINEGQMINLSQLRKPLLIKRGEVIRVRARAAGVQITTTARATEDGALGDIVMVESLENRKKYPTHVTGSQQVEVYAAGVIAADSPRPTAQHPSQLTEKK